MSLVHTIYHYLAPLNRIYYLGQTKNRKIYKVNKSVKFMIRLNTPDKFAVWEVWRLKSYCDKKYRISPTDTIVDIGAHIGTFSVWVSRSAKKGRVFAFEPDRNNYELLQYNKNLNKCSNLSCFQLAVSDTTDNKILYTQKENNNVNHSLYPDKYAKKVIVFSTTLNQIIEKQKLNKIDLLKIDAEGAEYPILFSTTKKNFKKIKRIYCEYHDNLDHRYKINDLISYLGKMGFKVKKSSSIINFKHLLFDVGYIKAYRE